MTKTTAAILAAAVLGAATPATAQADAPASLSGIWAGVITGYDSTGTSDQGNNDRLNGLAYGAQLGFNADLGKVVLGLEAEYADSTAKRSFVDGTSRGTFRAARDLYVGARVGAKVSPAAMIYAKGGYTNARYDVTGTVGTTAFGGDVKADGFRLGAGAEYAVSSNSFVKLEYRYSNYSEGRFNVGTTPGSNFAIDANRHQVMAGVGVRF